MIALYHGFIIHVNVKGVARIAQRPGGVVGVGAGKGPTLPLKG